MKKNICWIFLIFFALCPLVFSEEMVIKLKDGVVVRGEVVSMQDGIYKIKSRMLGEIAVRSCDVLSITMSEDVFDSAQDKKTIERQIVSNPELMRSVQSLAQDESVLEMLADPKLKAAIMRQDVEYLKQDKKFKKFMDHSAVKSIVQGVSEQAQDTQGQ